MDELIIDEFEIETETDIEFEEDIISNDIEVLNISVDDSMDDLFYDLIYQTEYLDPETVPETELISAENETVPETELISAENETVPETELISSEPETIPETELIIIENIASEHLDSLGVLNETVQDIQMDKISSDQQVIQEEILSDNKEIEQEDTEKESEFSFVELVKDNSKNENLKDGSNNDNTLYDLDDIYNLISLRIPENSRLFTSEHNLDDIYNLLSDNMSPDILSPTYVRTLNDDVEVVEVEEDLKKAETDAAAESETISLTDIYDLIDEQNQILKSNQEVEIAILQNQKTISDNDNKMNTFLVSGVFAILGAVVISNLFRGIK